MKTLVLVGGGHAHVQVLRRFAMDPPSGIRLIVILDRPVAVYSGMVPGFVAGDYTHSDLGIDVVPLARLAGASVILSPATDVDPVRKTVSIEGRPPIRFDLLSLDVGSTVRGLDLPGVQEHALSTRPIASFVYALEAHLARLRALGRPAKIAVVGGGAAGTELAFTLDARLADASVPREITVYAAEKELLANASAATRRALEREANAREIATHFDVRVTRVDAGALVARQNGDESKYDADLVIWATGASPVAFPAHEGTARLKTDSHGFIEVRDTLQTIGFDDVFAVGDCARLVDHPWVPRAGVYAVRQGPILEANLRARLTNQSIKPYRPQRDFLSLLNLGHGRALGSKWGRAFASTSVFRLKDWIDRRFMDRFQVLDESGRPRPALAKLSAMGSSDDEAEMMCGGCAAKLGAEPLAAALALMPAPPSDDTVILGLDARDDVAATRGPDGATMLHNIDVIRAFADDPWLVGRVAAANALSDLHAKGGKPRHAQAIVGLPELFPHEAEAELFQVLSGLRSILDPLGVSLLGGHTTIGDALTVGLSVSGDGPTEAELVRQTGARAGDVLLLTQPLGTGVILAADMRGLARGNWLIAAHDAMQHVNDVAGEITLRRGVHAATDVTGFGFAGHLLTLLSRDDLLAELDGEAMPLLPGARTLWADGLVSTADPANRMAFEARVDAPEADLPWLFDPQTAGGLLLAVAPEAVDGILAEFKAAGEPPVSRVGRIGTDVMIGGAIRVGIPATVRAL